MRVHARAAQDGATGGSRCVAAALLLIALFAGVVCAANPANAVSGTAGILTGSEAPGTATHVGEVVTYAFIVRDTNTHEKLTAVSVRQDRFTGRGTKPVITCPSTSVSPGSYEHCSATYTLVPADLKQTSFSETATAYGTYVASNGAVGTGVVSTPLTLTVKVKAITAEPPPRAHLSTFVWSAQQTRACSGTWILVSPDGTHRAVFQRDCNLVVYSGSRPVWASRSAGDHGSTFYLGDNGLLRIAQNVGGREVNSWRNSLAAYSTTRRLAMQNDGNLVEYAGTSGSTVIWATYTNGR